MLKQYGLKSEALKDQMNKKNDVIEKVKDGGKYVDITYKDGSIGHYGYHDFRYILRLYGIIK